MCARGDGADAGRPRITSRGRCGPQLGRDAVTVTRPAAMLSALRRTAPQSAICLQAACPKYPPSFMDALSTEKAPGTGRNSAGVTPLFYTFGAKKATGISAVRKTAAADVFAA